jgi:predicted MFS family arabinose efflux permease
VLFALYGTILGTWTARIPAVKQGLRLSDGQLSVGLLAFAAGAITGMQLAGRLVDRFGSGRLAVPAVLADGLLLLAPGLAGSWAALIVSLYLFGTVHGCLNIAMNVRGVEVQRAWQRPIITSFHAVYSMGGFLGAAIGGLFAAAALGPRPTFVAVAALSVAGGLLAAYLSRGSSVVLPAPAPAASDGRRARLRGVTFLGVLVFCCLVGEGAAADWSSVYLRDSLGSSAGFAAAGYAAFSVMMMAGRLVGDRLGERIGPVALVRGSGLLAAVGLGACLLVGQPVAGVIGFGCLGAGLSCIAPQVFSTAGNQNPATAGTAIARVASLGFLGFVVGPVVIGGLAELSSLPRALALPAVLALFVALSATALRARPSTVEPASRLPGDAAG